jgi:hypothetical protein
LFFKAMSKFLDKVEASFDQLGRDSGDLTAVWQIRRLLNYGKGVRESGGQTVETFSRLRAYQVIPFHLLFPYIYVIVLEGYWPF